MDSNRYLAIRHLSALMTYNEYLMWSKENKSYFSNEDITKIYSYLKSYCHIRQFSTEYQKGQQLSKIDVLLSRTIAENFDFIKIKYVYNGLLNNKHKEVQDLMTMLLLNIAKGDTIKFHFSSDDIGYNRLSNIIQLSSEDSVDIGIDAAVIHEIAHYVFDKMFNFNALPFSFDKIINDNFAGIFTSRFDKKLDFLESSLVQIKQLPSVAKEITKHQEAYKQTLVYAASLLKINITEIQLLDSVQEISDYLKNHSPIDLFVANFVKRDLNNQHLIEDSLSTNEITNIIELYWSKAKNQTCANNLFLDKTNETFPTQGEIIDYSLIHYLPQIVKENKLDIQKILFLERIADLIARGRNFFNYDRATDFYEKHSEYLVRLPEFIVEGLNDEIMQSMSKAKEFWYDHISPMLNKLLMIIIKSMPNK